MSVLEMKEEIKIKVDLIDDEDALAKALDILNNSVAGNSIDLMYNEAVQQYGDTLRKLAQ